MEIRLATALDADAIASLHIESWRTTYRGMLSDKYLDEDIFVERQQLWRTRLQSPPANLDVLLAMDDGLIAGFASLLGDEDGHWGSMLDNLHVAAGHKGQGLGARMMRESAQWLHHRYPGHGMYLWVVEQNINARRFYDKMQGQVADTEIWYTPDGGELSSLRYAWKDLPALGVCISI